MARKKQRLVYIVENTPDTRNAEDEALIYNSMSELEDAVLDNIENFDGSVVWVVDLRKVKQQTIRPHGVVIE
jgi:hypothetical protein